MNNKHFNTKRYSHIPNSEGSNSFPINRANSLNTFRGQISSRQNETSSSTLNQSGTALNILKEVIQINEILGDLKKNDWKVRIEKIDRLKFCMMQVANAYEDDNEMKNIQIGQIMRQIQKSIITQINDLRSTVAKAACLFIVWMSTEFPDVFGQTYITKSGNNYPEFGVAAQCNNGGNGITYFNQDALFKLLSNGNKTLSDLGHQTITEILSNNNCLTKIFPYLCSFMQSKSPVVRNRVAQYFYIVMRNYDIFTINQNTDFIDVFLVGAIEDQNQSVRNQAKRCFQLYRQLLRDKSTILLMHGIQSIQIRKQLAIDLNIDMMELNQELMIIEESQKISQQYLDDYIAGENGNQIITPLKEKVKKVQNRFEGAKTPEQFIRAKNRATGERGGNMKSKSPMKMQTQMMSFRDKESQEGYFASQVQRINFNNQTLSKNQSSSQIYSARGPVDYGQQQNGFQSSRMNTLRVPSEQRKVLGSVQSQGKYYGFQNSERVTPQRNEQLYDDRENQEFSTVQAFEIQRTQSSRQLSTSRQRPVGKSPLLNLQHNNKLETLRKKYTPLKQVPQESFRKHENGTKRIVLDLANQQQKNNQSQALLSQRTSPNYEKMYNLQKEEYKQSYKENTGCFTERKNSKIGIGLKNVMKKPEPQPNPKTQTQNFFIKEPPRSKSNLAQGGNLNQTRRYHNQLSKQISSQIKNQNHNFRNTMNVNMHHNRRQSEENNQPLPFGVSPRPQEFSPRLDQVQNQQSITGNEDSNEQSSDFQLQSLRSSRMQNAATAQDFHKPLRIQNQNRQRQEQDQMLKATRVKRIAIELNSKSRERSMKPKNYLMNNIKSQTNQINSNNFNFTNFRQPENHENSRPSLKQMDVPKDDEDNLFENIEHKVSKMDNSELNQVSFKPQEAPLSSLKNLKTRIMMIEKSDLKQPFPQQKQKIEKQIELITKEKETNQESIKIIIDSIKLQHEMLKQAILHQSDSDSISNLTLKFLELISFICSIQQVNGSPSKKQHSNKLQELLQEAQQQSSQLIRTSFKLTLKIMNENEYFDYQHEVDYRMKMLLQIFNMNISAQNNLNRDKAKDVIVNTALNYSDNKDGKDCLTEQLTMIMQIFEESAEKNPKKLEALGKLVSSILSKIMDSGYQKNKETMSQFFEFILKILLQLNQKDAFDDSTMFESLVEEHRSDNSNERNQNSKLNDGLKQSATQELMQLLQNAEKKGGHVKDLIVKFKQRDPDQFRQFGIIVRRSQNHFLNRFVKELTKQGFLAQNTTLPRVNSKTNHQLLQQTFNWSKPNISGAASVYNFRGKRESIKKDTRKSRVDEKQKGFAKESQRGDTKDGFDDLLSHNISPPKSQAHGMNRQNYQFLGKNIEEEKSCVINNDILNQAEPATSVIGDNDSRNVGEQFNMQQKSQNMQLDETFIAKAPVLIDEHDENDEITVKKVSEQSKNKSATTQASELTSEKRIRPKIDWKQAIGLDQTQSQDTESILNHLVMTFIDGNLKIQQEVPEAILMDFIIPQIKNFKVDSDENLGSNMVTIVDILSLIQQYPYVEESIKSCLHHILVGSFVTQTKINLEKAKKREKINQKQSVFETMVMVLINQYKIGIDEIFLQSEQILNDYFEDLQDVPNLEELKPNESKTLTFIVHIIEFLMKLLCKMIDKQNFEKILRSHLNYLLEANCKENDNKILKVNHQNVLIRRAIIMSFVELKFKMMKFDHLVDIIEEQLQTHLNNGQQQIINIYLEKRQALEIEQAQEKASKSRPKSNGRGSTMRSKVKN